MLLFCNIATIFCTNTLLTEILQEFWQYYNNLPSIATLPPGSSYHLMRPGILPLWEDEANLHGGTLSLRVPRKESAHAWLQLLLGVIGEQFTFVLHPDDELCGISVSTRKTEAIISVWNLNAELVDVPLYEAQLRRLVVGVDIRKTVFKGKKKNLDEHQIFVEIDRTRKRVTLLLIEGVVLGLTFLFAVHSEEIEKWQQRYKKKVSKPDN